MSTDKERWEPLRPKDLVFETSNDGAVTVVKMRDSVFGALVRKRNGRWMKRMDPLTIQSISYIQSLAKRKRFKKGAELLSA